MGILGDPENFIPANPLVTPVHIQPEWYFLIAYAILRSIPNKLGGVIALAISMLMLSMDTHMLLMPIPMPMATLMLMPMFHLDQALVKTPSPKAWTQSPRDMLSRDLLMLMLSMLVTDTHTATDTFLLDQALVLTQSPKVLTPL